MTTDNPIKAWIDERRKEVARAQRFPTVLPGSPTAQYVLGERRAYEAKAGAMFPTALSMIEAVLELHSELTIYELDDSNGAWKYDEDDERVVLARICQSCSSDEAVEHVGDNEWSDTWDDGSVEYPCATRQALEGVIDGG